MKEYSFFEADVLRRGGFFLPSATSRRPLLCVERVYVRMQDTNNWSEETNIFTSPTTMPSFVTEYPQFITATNLEWKKLLQPEKYKNIIINSLRF